MKKAFSFLVLVFTFLSFSSSAWSNEKLDSLLKKVLQERTEESQIWKEREAEFLKEKGQQSALLAKAKKELREIEAIGNQLNSVYEKNEEQLRELEENKGAVMGAFGELYGVVRQMSGDFFSQIQYSPVSAQRPERFKTLQALAQTRTLPSYEQLESFWFILQEEMTLQAQTAEFQAPVTDIKGVASEQEVHRVGAFSLFTGKNFVSYNGLSNVIEVYPRQPESRYTRSLAKFIDAQPGDVALVSFDPAKGALLETLIQAPSFLERVDQGGIVGYIILFILAVGLIISAERLYFYSRQEKKMAAQLKDPSKADLSTPYGVLLDAFKKHKDQESTDVISLRLSEVVLHEMPRLQRGLSTLKTFVAVAPLLGLLGTVTGMIVTFQSITMFGSGDPKLMAGGISQALVTTVQGLSCAIPLLLIYTYVNGKYQNILTFLNEQLAGMLAEKESQ